MYRLERGVPVVVYVHNHIGAVVPGQRHLKISRGYVEVARVHVQRAPGAYVHVAPGGYVYVVVRYLYVAGLDLRCRVLRRGRPVRRLVAQLQLHVRYRNAALKRAVHVYQVRVGNAARAKCHCVLVMSAAAGNVKHLKPLPQPGKEYKHAARCDLRLIVKGYGHRLPEQPVGRIHAGALPWIIPLPRAVAHRRVARSRPQYVVPPAYLHAVHRVRNHKLQICVAGYVHGVQRLYGGLRRKQVGNVYLLCGYAPCKYLVAGDGLRGDLRRRDGFRHYHRAVYVVFVFVLFKLRQRKPR